MTLALATAPLSTSEWLTMGGDRRIALDTATGLNAYGCPPVPEPKVLAYGSATASTISSAGFLAAEALLHRLPQNLSVNAYASELARMRHELTHLCGLDELAPNIIFSPSGTDLHAFVAELTAPDLVIMSEAGETGSGVPAALSGGDANKISAVALRMEDGNPRALAQINAEVQTLATEAARAGKKVLLVVTDVSKTGLIAPSSSVALDLQQRFPSMVEVLVDACQFRLAPSTLRTYLKQGFCVAITGSKFIGGPAFSGALFVPQGAAQRTRPPSDDVNMGLLLRWEAALTELRAFQSLPEKKVSAFLELFANAIETKLANNPAFMPLAVLKLDRIPTIFSFLLRRGDAWLNREETKRIYERLRAEGCQLGQPVLCGARDGTPISALRVCLSARLIVDAVSGRGAQAITDEALGVLDKVAKMV